MYFASCNILSIHWFDVMKVENFAISLGIFYTTDDSKSFEDGAIGSIVLTFIADIYRLDFPHSCLKRLSAITDSREDKIVFFVDIYILVQM